MECKPAPPEGSGGHSCRFHIHDARSTRGAINFPLYLDFVNLHLIPRSPLMFWMGLFRSTRPRVARPAAPRTRPAVEALEVREVLSGAAYLDPVAAGVRT